jgi:hypothetical protein
MFEPTTRCKEPTSSSTRLPFLSSLFVCSVLACSAKGPSAGNTADMYTADTAGLSAPTDETSLAPMGAPTLTDSAASMASGTVTSLPVDTAAGHSDVGPTVNPAPNNSQSGETNTGNSATSTIPSGVLSDASSQTVGASTTSATDNGSSGGASTGHSPPCVDPAAGIPSLHEYFANSFAIGAAIDTQYQLYAPVLTKHFNSVTAEDQMKFDALQPTEGDFTYTTADQMVDFAVTNGMQVRGHALVWHRQTPAWVFNGTSDQVLARMQNHITQVMQHFRAK